MGRALLILSFILVAGYAFDLSATSTEHAAIQRSSGSASVILALDRDISTFSETGTLVFYPNNVGPVPYLFYQNRSGNTVAKALVLPYSSGVGSSWAGSRVSVVGALEGEHVLVSSISYLTAP